MLRQGVLDLNRLLILCLLLGFLSHDALARERIGSIGGSISTPLRLQPTEEIGDTSINILGEYFIDSYFSWVGQLEFAVNGINEKNVVLGMRGYPWPYYLVRPFLSFSGVFQFDPRADGGVRGGGGFEVQLDEILDWTRIAIFYETNFMVLLRDPQIISWEYYRAGLVVRF